MRTTNDKRPRPPHLPGKADEEDGVLIEYVRIAMRAAYADAMDAGLNLLAGQETKYKCNDRGSIFPKLGRC